MGLTYRAYPHMPIPCPHAARFHKRRILTVTFTSAHLYGNVFTRVGVARALAVSFDCGLLGSKKFPKMGDSLPWTSMNRLAKCDASRFIVGGEIRNRTNKQTHTQAHRETNTLTVTDIPTPCLSACADNYSILQYMCTVYSRRVSRRIRRVEVLLGEL